MLNFCVGRVLPAHAQTECGGPAKDPGGTLPHRNSQKLQCPV